MEEMVKFFETIRNSNSQSVSDVLRQMEDDFAKFVNDADEFVTKNKE